MLWLCSELVGYANVEPDRDAEWILESIIKDYAKSLGPREQAQFYARLVELIQECLRSEEEDAEFTASKRGLDDRIQ